MATSALNTALPTTASGAAGRSWLASCFSVLGALATSVIVIIGCFVCVAAAATRLSTNADYTVFGHPALVVLSGSMSPTINTGDFIVDNPVTRTEASHLRVGQIISFYAAPGSKVVFTHRIVKVLSQHHRVLYETKGDFNNSADAALRPASDVIGVYALKIPRGGYFLYNLHRPIVLGLLLASPLLWLLAGLFRSWAAMADDPSPANPARTAL